MLCEYERSVSASEALAIIESAYAREGLSAELIAGMPGSLFPVYRCTVRDANGQAVAHSSGKGQLEQARASALFEAWQHLQHRRGQSSLPQDGRLRVMPIREVLEQPELRREAMLYRLAEDFPSCELACMRYQAVADTADTIWYPAFARNPSYRWHPAEDDELEYTPYLRYAYDSGTASGVNIGEAVLHGLLEVIERDALSMAFLDWYVRDPPEVRLIDMASFPIELCKLRAEVEEFINNKILFIDITSDIGVPGYAALPGELDSFPGSIGSGASLSSAYAAERSLTELAQAVHFARLDIDTTHQHRLENLQQWPILEICARLDRTPFRKVANRYDFTEQCTPLAADKSIPEQINILTGMLVRQGFRPYSFSWTTERADCPVVTVLVPGLDWFAMVHNATPILPTGRLMPVLNDLRVDLAS
jgi:ribosomal protein S12 methylthiotransferase accessory factor